MSERKIANVNATHELLMHNGWSIESMTESTIRAVRGKRERLEYSWWADGSIHILRGQVASGPVSVRRVQDRGWNSTIWQAEVDAEVMRKPASEYTDYEYELHVSAGEVKRSWETASNYTLHELVPGVYPVELVGIEYHPSIRPYYAIAMVDTFEVERHYVNRLLSHSNAHTEQMHVASSIMWDVYSYNLKDDEYVSGPFRAVRREGM